MPVALLPSTVEAAAELQSAFERRRGPHWPATLLETLRHPVLSRVLLLELQHPTDSAPVRVREPVIRPEPQPEPASGFVTATKPGSATVTKRDIDRKSLAAGERPDD